MSQTAAVRPQHRRIVGPIFVGLIVVIAAIVGTLIYRSASPTAAAANGGVPDGVTIFDDEYPAVTNLDPELLRALRAAATDAAADGVEFTVNSGWRSPEYQQQLLREAVAEYGSEQEAARWVATPATSAQVSGDAVDIGPVGATPWLASR